MEHDRREIKNIPGRGLCLIESVIEALIQDYDVQYTTQEILQKITDELLNDLEYTTFLKSPITQNEVEYNIMDREVMDRTKQGGLNYSRAICSFYLPAMATALDLHIRVIQNISGYYAVLNTLPSKSEKPEKRMKKVTLVL